MSFFLLTERLNEDIYKKIDLEFIEDLKDSKIGISISLHTYLNNIKILIDNCKNNWDNVKKITNPYEYIHSIIPDIKYSVSKLKPLSRSYYKMIEIYNLLIISQNSKNFKKIKNKNKNLKFFCLAEGPGGFIEALVSLRQNENDLYYGITLLDQDINTPGWKKSKQFLSNNKNVNIESGIDNTGNLFSYLNYMDLLNKYKGSIDFITGDGGIDFSSDFNKQEILSGKLILIQLIYGLSLQKENGTFILKIFDMFTELTIDIIYILCNLYKQVYIIKPFTSRLANSEKYLVCKEFKLNIYKQNELINKFQKIFGCISNNDLYINRIFKDFQIPYLFISKLEELNAILGQQQIENIYNTLTLIEQSKINKLEKMDVLKRNNVQKSLNWCIKYGVPYNRQIINNYLNNNNKDSKK